MRRPPLSALPSPLTPAQTAIKPPHQVASKASGCPTDFERAGSAELQAFDAADAGARSGSLSEKEVKRVRAAVAPDELRTRATQERAGMHCMAKQKFASWSQEMLQNSIEWRVLSAFDPRTDAGAIHAAYAAMKTASAAGNAGAAGWLGMRPTPGDAGGLG